MGYHNTNGACRESNYHSLPGSMGKMEITPHSNGYRLPMSGGPGVGVLAAWHRISVMTQHYPNSTAAYVNCRLGKPPLKWQHRRFALTLHCPFEQMRLLIHAMDSMVAKIIPISRKRSSARFPFPVALVHNRQAQRAVIKWINDILYLAQSMVEWKAGSGRRLFVKILIRRT